MHVYISQNRIPMSLKQDEAVKLKHVWHYVILNLSSIKTLHEPEGPCIKIGGLRLPAAFQAVTTTTGTDIISKLAGSLQPFKRRIKLYCLMYEMIWRR